MIISIVFFVLIKRLFSKIGSEIWRKLGDFRVCVSTARNELSYFGIIHQNFYENREQDVDLSTFWGSLIKRLSDRQGFLCKRKKKSGSGMTFNRLT